MSAPSCNWLPPLSLFLMVLCPAGGASADGKFFRRLEVADEPGIQAQRAVIAFRDGYETLIVQSDVQGEGTSFGWVLPPPAEPTSIEPCGAHTLISLSNVVRPRVSDLPKAFLPLSILVLLITIAACLDVLRYRGQPKVLFSPWRITLSVVGLLILIGILLPSLSAPRGLSGEVEILQTSKAGVYDVSIIKGETGAAVAEWLKSNGFAWSSSADPVMQAYVAADWCFLVAKVAPD
ncbi:MAG: DUF2330 domain-containing protein, partial [Phycisphaerales bacterium]